MGDKDILLPVWWDRARDTPEDPVLRHVNRTRAALAAPPRQEEEARHKIRDAQILNE